MKAMGQIQRQILNVHSSCYIKLLNVLVFLNLNKKLKISNLINIGSNSYMQLQLARKSIAEAPRPSKMSLHPSKMSIRPEPEKIDANKSNGDIKVDIPTIESPKLSDEHVSLVIEEHRKSLQEEKEEEAKLEPFYRLHILGFFKGLLERLSLLMQLPEALKVNLYINLV